MHVVSWHFYGYGINADKIETDEARLRKFIESQPAVKEQFIAWEKEEVYCTDPLICDKYAHDAYETESVSELCELYRDHGKNADVYGIAGIVEMVLSASAGFPLVSCRNYEDDVCYVIMPKYYPWDVNDELLKIKNEDDIKAVFAKALAILTDQSLDELDWGEQEVEGGCC